MEEAMAVLDEQLKEQVYDGLKKLGLTVAGQIGSRTNR
jgi:antitoxin component of RelBE/YafQ-DinJ toxin-antitoxin module